MKSYLTRRQSPSNKDRPRSLTDVRFLARDAGMHLALMSWGASAVLSALWRDGAAYDGFKFMVRYLNMKDTTTANHVHLVPAVFFSSSWKRGAMYRRNISKTAEDSGQVTINCIIGSNTRRVDWHNNP